MLLFNKRFLKQPVLCCSIYFFAEFNTQFRPNMVKYSPHIALHVDLQIARLMNPK